jgi:hypothetical protein
MKKQTYVQVYVRTKSGAMKVNDVDRKYVVDRHMLPAVDTAEYQPDIDKDLLLFMHLTKPFGLEAVQ